MAEKTRYSDAELEEFRAIIMEKLQLAERDYEKLKSSIMNADGNDTLSWKSFSSRNATMRNLKAVS